MHRTLNVTLFLVPGSFAANLYARSDLTDVMQQQTGRLWLNEEDVTHSALHPAGAMSYFWRSIYTQKSISGCRHSLYVELLRVMQPTNSIDSIYNVITVYVMLTAYCNTTD